MELFSYVVARDYGFAPNPFHGFCTLATCKPQIRKAATPGDWIIGIAPKKRQNRLVYFMEVSEKMTFDEYWNDERFQLKKPVLSASRMFAFGDNIYRQDKGKWCQLNSHHSYPTGRLNPANVLTDTSEPFVLIAENFSYFGGEGPHWPDDVREFGGETLIVSRSHRCNFSSSYKGKIIEYLKRIGFQGFQGEPLDWKKEHRA